MKKLIALLCIWACTDLLASAISYEDQIKYLLIQRNIVEVEVYSYKETPIEDHKKHKIEVTGRILTVYRGDKKLLGRFFHTSNFWTIFGSRDDSPMHFTKGERYAFYVESIDESGKLELTSIDAKNYGMNLGSEAYEQHLIKVLKDDKRIPFEMIRVQPYPPRKHY